MKTSTFLETFVGEYVEIIMDFQVTSSVQLDQEGTAQQLQTPLTVSGFFMDFQEGLIYLSPDGENVNQAIPFNSMKHIAIIDIVNEMDQLIDQGDIPGNDGEYH